MKRIEEHFGVVICGGGMDGAWKCVHREQDNSSCRRQHPLPEAVETTRLRLLVEKTHLSRSAGLAEIRCY